MKRVALGGGRSIQLSYWDNIKKRAKIHDSNLIARLFLHK